MSDTTCARTGCTFPRGWRPGQRGIGNRRNTHCGNSCMVWAARAKRAVAQGDADEARELLALSDLLDARTDAGQVVPGVFDATRRDALHAA